MSNSSGFSHTVSSWFAEPMLIATVEPAGTGTPADLGVARRGAHDADQRRLPPQALFDRLRHQRAVGAQRVELVGVRQQSPQQIRRRPVRRFGAGGKQQPQERADLVVVEAHALELGLREHRDHVVGRVHAPFGDDRAEVVVQLLRRLRGALELEARADDRDRAAVEHREVFAGEAEQSRDDDDRERERHLAHEIGGAAGRGR